MVEDSRLLGELWRRGGDSVSRQKCSSAPVVVAAGLGAGLSQKEVSAVVVVSPSAVAVLGSSPPSEYWTLERIKMTVL